MADPKFNIVFAWDMHYQCNCRCPYCFYTTTGWEELSQKSHYASPEQWKKVWDRIRQKYGTCQIRITAGEPFSYPHFVDIVEMLSQDHYIQITTNCTLGPVMKELSQRANPHRVELDCTFHPMEIDFDTFVENVQTLRKAGFTANVCYLAYPPFIPRMAQYKKDFFEKGIQMNLAIYWGEYEGKKYPFGYLPEEKEQIKQVIGTELGPEIIGLEPLSVKGKICGAGQRYAVIHSDGKVVRCGQLGYDHQIIGDIFDPNFELFENGKPCETDYCRCKEFQSAWDEEDKRKLIKTGVISK